MENLTRAFRDIRLRCRKSTESSDIQYLITKFKFIFNHSCSLDNAAKFNKRLNQYLNYRDIMNILFKQFPYLKKAYDLKEKYIIFNETSTIDNARDNLTHLICNFANSAISEYIPFYNLLINWNQEIINSFCIYKGKRINNSYIESQNSKIERLIYNANGFSNFRRTSNRILYCINKNDTFRI